MKIRVMTDKGIQKFREYLSNLKNGNNPEKPDLNTEENSKLFVPEIEIEDSPEFENKYEMAEYLYGLLKENNIPDYKGLWTWIAYHWFEILLGGKKRPTKDEHYIQEDETDHWLFHRHLVSSSYNIYKIHGEKSLFFLCGPVFKHPDTIEQLASRQSIIKNKEVIKVVWKIYMDQKRKKPKEGCTSSKNKGNIRRFVDFINQIELTYDISNMSENEIYRLIPGEIKEWEKK